MPGKASRNDQSVYTPLEVLQDYRIDVGSQDRDVPGMQIRDQPGEQDRNRVGLSPVLQPAPRSSGGARPPGASDQLRQD
jgi:hypothetical protein